MGVLSACCRLELIQLVEAQDIVDIRLSTAICLTSDRCSVRVRDTDFADFISMLDRE